MKGGIGPWGRAFCLLGVLGAGFLAGCELVHRPLRTVPVEPSRPAKARPVPAASRPEGKRPAPVQAPPTRPVPPTRPAAPPPAKPTEAPPIPPFALTPEERQAEFAAKLQRLEGFLAGRRLDALLLKRPENFAWLSGGGSNGGPTGAAEDRGALLLRRGGKRYLLAPQGEVFRWLEEDLAGLGFLPKPFKWYKRYLGPEEQALVQALTAHQAVGADVASPGMAWVGPEIDTLRRTLTAEEIRKYRWLGQQTAAAVARVARTLQKGETEEEVAARLKGELWAARIEPAAVWVTADERRVKYGPAPPQPTPLQQAAFLNVAAHRWGLWIGLTRTVYLVPPEAAARRQQKVLLDIAGRLQAAMRLGQTLGQILQFSRQVSRQAGYGEEWEPPEPGGIVGYRRWEAVAFPGSPVPLRENQAIVWRVRLPRLCLEETFLATAKGLEVLTATDDWPTRSVRVAGRPVQIPDILERSNEEQ